MAYRIAAEKVAEVTAYLDHREKAGYVACEVLFHPDEPTDRPPFPLTVYMSPQSPDNPHYVGEHESLDEIAETVVACHGPSGSNVEYVVRLAETMRRRAPPAHQDPYLLEVERRVVARCRERGTHGLVLDELGL